MSTGSDTIGNERREAATEHPEWAAPAAAEVSGGAGPSVAAPRRPWWRRRAGLTVAAVVAGLLLLGGGFGIGYAVGSSTGSSSPTGFDPRGQMPDGGFGQGGGPGSQLEIPDGTESGTGVTSGTTAG
ncbi:hypothetical protein GSU68_11010 [Rathayibacter sp. VKM Ac-2759]|uniref:hypothetical protein n=1 Tax=Rathayibacter sp. VKM Ac-2759 TaxID=2609252 RepID=UPI001318BA0C|nr:hypothetical protein [Rathayibacter sp. VKM Ac-2759]QHC67038.1 hypothetical protein GSU68_11010 [Rathayibacter sp. VKM Ac-2759]